MGTEFLNTSQIDSVVGWGAVVQAGRSRMRFPMKSVDFSIYLNVALWSTQPLTEMSTRNLPRGKGRLSLKVDNLTDICEPIVYKMWEPRRLSTLWASEEYYYPDGLDA
jgi:hypothetical protein